MHDVIETLDNICVKTEDMIRSFIGLEFFFKGLIKRLFFSVGCRRWVVGSGGGMIGSRGGVVGSRGGVSVFRSRFRLIHRFRMI